jgi:hypothetical protein
VGHHDFVSISAVHADAFYAEAVSHGEVCGIRDADGFPAPESDGRRAMPFWSTQSRAQRVIDNVEAYEGFEVVALSLDQWQSRWLPGLHKDGIWVGLNWSGGRATGYDVSAEDVARNISSRVAH